jgi:hypothetical protein
VISYRGSEGSWKQIVGSFGQYELAKLQERLGVAYLGAGSKDLLDGDWSTNFRARFDSKSAVDRLEAQYVAARSLAARIDKVYAGTPYQSYSSNLTLTGHSLGGALASYAGQNVRSAQVFTFDAGRNSLVGTGDNLKQINIIARGDPASMHGRRSAPEKWPAARRPCPDARTRSEICPEF